MQSTLIIAVSGRSATGMTSLCDRIREKLQSRGVNVEYFSCLFVAEAAIGAACGENMTTLARNGGMLGKTFEGITYHETVLDIDQAIRIGRSQEFIPLAIKRKIKHLQADCAECIIVDDVRYQEDFRELKSLGAKFVRIADKSLVSDDGRYRDCVQPGDLSDTNLDEIPDREWDVLILKRTQLDNDAEAVLKKLVKSYPAEKS